MLKIIAIIVAVLLLSGGIGIGIGRGFGTGNGAQILEARVEENKDEETENEKREVIIKVEENRIYVDENECAGIEELKDAVKRINSQEANVKYVFEHEYAIKATYDEVNQALLDLEEVLGISVDNGKERR